MKHSFAILFVALLSVGDRAQAQSNPVACDLVDQRTATAILASPITQHTPNRQTQSIDNAKLSACLFHSERSTLVVKLLEYPSPSDAQRAFSDATSPGGAASFTPEPRLGDAAAWWKMATEGYGFVVQKGNRVFMLDTRWKDANSGAGLKERIKPAVDAAVRKL